jgi:WD40 repeat protein
VWQTESGELVRILEGHRGPVSKVVAVDSQRLLSASHDKTLILWSSESGQIMNIFEGHSKRINDVAVIDQRLALSGSDDETLRVWDLESGQTLHILEGHSDRVRAVRYLIRRTSVNSVSRQNNTLLGCSVWKRNPPLRGEHRMGEVNHPATRW